MTSMTGPALTRVTVAASERRVDVALPGDVTVGELLPHVLRHAGEELADRGETHGGWVLRRGTGMLLQTGRTLTAQEVRDGEILHLVPRRLDWPEPAYDDVVDLIAADARRVAKSWDGAATRLCGLTVTVVTLVLGLALLVMAGSPWRAAGVAAVIVAAGTNLTGALVSRAFHDATAAAVPALCGLPYALLGGVLVTAPTGGLVPHLDPYDLLAGASALLLFSVLGFFGVGALPGAFMTGAAVGAFGAGGAGLALAGLSPTGSAALTVATVIGLLPGYPLLASWLGRLPMPELPDRPEAILRDQPLPARSDVFATVARATGLLSGLLRAAAIVSVAALLPLLGAGAAARALCLTGCAALVLRGRLFATPSQRIPLLVAGGAGLAALAVAVAVDADSQAGRLWPFYALLAVAGLVFAAALVFSRRRPSPRVGRIADVVDIVAVTALVPLACAVLGVYQAVRDAFAGIGG